MAGAYLDIPLGRDYTFTTNVASRLAEVGASINGATLYFLAKVNPFEDADSAAILNVTPSANATTNVVTVTIPRANTNVAQPYPTLFWEVSMTTNTTPNFFYNLDQGRAAISQAVRETIP